MPVGHPLVGTWVDGDRDYGSGVEFTIRAASTGFAVAAVDSDGEVLVISNVRWNGRTLSFDSFVPSNGHRVTYAVELISPSEVSVRYSVTERWVRKP